MAIRRTRQQKEQARLKREEHLSYSMPPTQATVAVVSAPIAKTPPQMRSTHLFGYEPQLIYRDLLRTLIVASGLVAVLLGVMRYT